MRLSVVYISILVIFACALSTQAQVKYYQPDTTVKVYADGKIQTLAWCGGFNNPQFAMADLNHDGLNDLIIFETWNSLRTFVNVGKAGTPDYRYAPEYQVNFPPLLNFMVLADYNCDGIPDLFHRGVYGFSAYKGYYNAYNQLAFKFYKNLFYQNVSPRFDTVNAFNNPGDIPSIVDVDGDGDLDFIAYDISGGTMNLYKNFRVENGLPCDSILIGLADQCWGKVYQRFERTHTLNYTCNNSTLTRPKSGNKKTHSGNSICLFDWDMDGDYDYLDGSVSFNEMTFLKNGRKEYNPAGPDSMVSQDTMWQSSAGGHRIDVPVWPAAYSIDIDQDGKKDLLISPNAQQLSENYNCVWFYKNFSSPGTPDWRFQSDTFLVDKTIDLGSYAYPVIYDYDKDGKPDLFVGSDGYYKVADGSLRSKISYYKNTSTTGSPSFTLQTKDFLNIDTFSFKGIAPAFGDIDGDTVADMVLGHADGTLSYYKNMAISDTALPVWKLVQLTMKDDTGADINVTSHAAPIIYDIDHDGNKDLVIGSVFGTLTYYQNISTIPGTISLRLVTKNLGHIKVDPNNNYGNYSTPFIGKIDSTGTEFLLMGSNSGNLYVYTGFQTGDTTTTYTVVSSRYAYIDSFYSIYNHSGTAYGYYGGLRTAVTVGDVGGDGTLNLFVGNNKGGVQTYRAKPYVAPVISHVSVIEPNERGKVELFPNPASSTITLSWSDILQPQLQISFINMAGQTIYTSAASTDQSKITISVDKLANGIYVCIVHSGVNRYYSKFTVVR